MICSEKLRQLQSNSCKFRLNSTKSKTVEQIHTNSDTQNRTWSKFIQWITSDFPFPLFPFSCIPLYCGGPWKPGGSPMSLLPEEVTSFLGVTNAAAFAGVGLPEKPGSGPWKPGASPTSLLPEEDTSSLNRIYDRFMGGTAAAFPAPDVPAPAFLPAAAILAVAAIPAPAAVPAAAFFPALEYTAPGFFPGIQRLSSRSCRATKARRLRGDIATGYEEGDDE